MITLDDATSAIYSAVLVEEEGTASTFRGLAEVIERHGPVHRALHRPRQPLLPHARGGREGLQDPADPGRPGAEAAGIGHIAAYSPQAAGRCERAFRTLQDRLPKELELAGITTVAAANRYLREVYLAEHNASFAVTPEQPASAFVPAAPELWRDLLCVQEERQVGNDNCVRWQGRVLQIPPSPLRPHFVRSTVRLHDYPDGTVAIFKGPHRLATFPPAAEPPARTWPRDRRDAARPVDLWTALRPAHNPTGPQQRPTHALPMVDKLTRSLQLARLSR